MRFPVHSPRTAALLTAAAAVVLAGALGIGVALRSRGAASPAATSQHRASAARNSASPLSTTTPTAAASPAASSPASTSPAACDGSVLDGRIADSVGAAGSRGADIVLHNHGPSACTMMGYGNFQGSSGGAVVQLPVSRSDNGELLNNNNGRLPQVRLIRVPPGGDAFVAFEYSDVTDGPTPCAEYATLLYTPPGAARPVSVSGAFSPCRGVDEAPVSSTAYFAQH